MAEEMRNDPKPVQTPATGTGDRKLGIDLARTASTMGTYTVRTWECPACKIRVIQGDPCPECDRRQLLD